MIAALLVSTFYARKRPAAGGAYLSTAFRDIDPEHYDKAVDATESFEKERRRAAPDIDLLSRLKIQFETQAREVLCRVPNDLVAEQALESAIVEALDALEDRIQYVRKRTPGKLLAFRYPVGEYFFRDFFVRD